MEQHLPQGTSWYLVIVAAGMTVGLVVYIWSGLISRVGGHGKAIEAMQGDVREIKTILKFAYPEYEGKGNGKPGH